MRWQIDYGDRPWHRWFAWHPVTLQGTGTRVWWEYVWRRIDNVQGYHIAMYTQNPDWVVFGVPFDKDPNIMGPINRSVGPCGGILDP